MQKKNEKEIRNQFDLLTKRAQICEAQFETLSKQYPTYIHHWNRSKFNVMWNYYKVKNWNTPITEKALKDWLHTIRYYERRLIRIAEEIYEYGIFIGNEFKI